MTTPVTISGEREAPTSQQRTWFEHVRAFLPEGRALPEADWNARHRVIVWLIWFHAIALGIFGLVQGWGPYYSLGESGLIAAMGLVAAWPRLGRRFRSGAAALALVTSSAVFTQFWGGFIEGHFHFFIVVAIVILYQDWVPFLLAVAYVAIDHGIVGTLAPEWVYNHPDAIAHPWKWAMYHAGLVLGECAVLLYVWRTNEQSRAQLDLLMNATGEAIIGLDRSGRVAFANPAASVIAGRPLNMLLGLRDEDFLQPATGSGPPAWEENGGGERLGGDNMVVVRPQGDRLPVIWARSPIVERGMVAGHVMTLLDATPHKRAEEERAHRLRQVSEMEHLQKVSQFKTLFINSAAHELHTPLTPLRLNLFALREGHKGSLTPEQHEVVGILERNVERLSLLVEDVLNAARLQANRLSIQASTVDLAQLAKETCASFEESAKHAGIKLELVAEPTVPINGDARRLGQVLYNLLDNAIKFSHRRGKVIVKVHRRDDGARIGVEDEGRGIDAADQERLFQPFSQVHNPMEFTRSGSGLGLYISKGIIDLHGGRIHCESAGRDQGTEFIVDLPADPPESAV